MYFEKTLYFFMTACIFITTATPNEELANISEEVILKELERFDAVKEKFVQANLNVSVTFTYSKANEDGRILKRDSFQFQPIVSKYNTEGPQLPEEYNKTTLNSVFALANKLNITVVGSREGFDTNGVLESKVVLFEKMRIDYNDGNSFINLNDDEDLEDLDDENVEEYLDILKEFALPITIEKTLFDQSGNIIKTDTGSYEPKKVRIESAENMSVEMQMKVAEALKRSCVLKQTGKERIMLLRRYLGIQFPEYTFEALIGHGLHYFPKDVSVKLMYDDDVYYIWGELKAASDDSDSD